MKRLFFALPLLALAGLEFSSNVQAAPLAKVNLPPDAQWLVHLDVAQWRTSRIGTAALEEAKKLKIEDMPEAIPLNPLQILDGLESITVFGDSFIEMAEEGPDGVVLVTVNEQLMQVVQGAVAAMEIQQPEQFQVVQDGDRQIYSVNGEIFGTFLDETSFALGKSLPTLQEFLALRGKPATQSDLVVRMSPAWSEGSSFLLVALADGINKIEGLPPQARILQLTQGISLQLWEESDALSVAAALVTDGPETGRQVQQVLQGLIAMAALTQNGDPEISMIVNSARVVQNGSTVRFQLSYPLDRAVHWIHILAEQIEMDAAAEIEISGEHEGADEAASTDEDSDESDVDDGE